MRRSFYPLLLVALPLATLLTVGGCPPVGDPNDPNDANTPSDGNTPTTGCTEWTVANVETSITIPAGCHRVNDSIQVSNGAILTLAPGARLEFAAGAGLTVLPDGALHAEGTAAQPIVLTGQSAARGYWRGVAFNDSAAAENALDYVTIEYGGKGGADDKANLMIYGGTRLSVRHTTLRESASHGFYFSGGAGDAQITAFDENVITRNALGAGHLYAWHVGFLDATSTFSGNDVNVVNVGGGLGNTSDLDQIWPAIDADYYISSTVDVHNTLTIAAGARLVFKNSTSLYLNMDGKLIAVGTATRPIVFTGDDQLAGSWNGISVHADSIGNVLQYATVEYAGKQVVNNHGALTIYDRTSFTIDHCIIQHSAGWGVWARGSTLNDDVATANTFADNALGDVHEE